MPKTDAVPIVADIGGTHIRLAMVKPKSSSTMTPLSLHHISKKRCRNYPQPIDAIQDYLNLHGCRATAMCLAVAGPVENGQASLTNHSWEFDQQHLKEAFNIKDVHIVNDFHAQAMSVPYLTEKTLLPIDNPSDPSIYNGASRLIIGPGTGLGVASLIKTQHVWHANPGEGGHIDFAPRTALDKNILEHLINKQNMNRVSVEDLLSGRGIERLYQAHSWLGNGQHEEKSDIEIIKQALEENDPVCIKVLQHFCEILGRVAGNAALTLGARNGVYIAGGLIPRFLEIFKHSNFRQAFEDKAPLTDYMKNIAVYVVLAEQPGLLGAAAILSQSSSLK